jgi:hypothetical protein
MAAPAIPDSELRLLHGRHFVGCGVLWRARFEYARVWPRGLYSYYCLEPASGAGLDRKELCVRVALGIPIDSEILARCIEEWLAAGCRAPEIEYGQHPFAAASPQAALMTPQKSF